MLIFSVWFTELAYRRVEGFAHSEQEQMGGAEKEKKRQRSKMNFLTCFTCLISQVFKFVHHCPVCYAVGVLVKQDEDVGGA